MSQKTGAEGFYTFKEDEYFYQGHFKDNPITPGVILTEVMAQIGVVCLGIYLLKRSRFQKIEKTTNSTHVKRGRFLFTSASERTRKSEFQRKFISALTSSNVKCNYLTKKKSWFVEEPFQEC